jgi:hypothetical protein
MSLYERLSDAWWRLRWALAKRRHDRISAKAYAKRCEQNGWFVAVFLVALANAHACGPSLATSAAIDQVEQLDAQCAGELDALTFAPGEDDTRIRAALAGCQERAATFCAEHHITRSDTELCP